MARLTHISSSRSLDPTPKDCDSVALPNVPQPAITSTQHHNTPILSQECCVEAPCHDCLACRHLRRGSEVILRREHQRRKADIVKAKRIPSISCRSIQQVQILSSFLELHFPSKEAKADLADRRSWLLALPEIDFSETPLLRNAVDTVCYAHLSSQHRDSRLQQESRYAYGRVLSGLMQELGRQKPQHDPQHITASMMLLCFYDDALPQPQSAVSGWQAHYLGAQEFLKARGPSSLDVSKPFDRLLFMNLRVPAIFLGIARRQGVMLGRPEWISLGKRHSQSNYSLALLYQYALQIPGVMEEAELVIGKRNPNRDLLEVCSKIQQLQGELSRWMRQSSLMASYWGKHQQNLVYISDTKAFDVTVEEQCVMESNPAFVSHYKYPDYNTVQDFALYLLFMMCLDCTLLRLLHLHPMHDSRYLRRTTEEVGRDAFATASDLCRTIHYQSGFESQGIAGFMDLLVALSQAFFEEVGAFDKVGWCQAIRCATQLRVERMRATQPKTLCRVGDLAEEIAAVGRFKMRDPRGYTLKAISSNDMPSRGCPFAR